MLLSGFCDIDLMGGSVNALDLSDVIRDILSGNGAFGIETLISLYAFPKTESANVVPENTGPEFDIVLYFKKVDTLLLGSLAPGRQMDLHHADGIGAGYSEGIGATLHDHYACDQSGIDIVFPTAVDNCSGDPGALAGIHLVPLQEAVHFLNRRIDSNK